MPLTSPRFAGNARLQSAANNSPAMGFGERGDAVAIVQQAYLDLGYPMPISTFKTGKPGPVPWQDGTLQAPHLTLRIFARGMLIHVITRVYFSDEPSNEHDPILSSISDAERRSTYDRFGHEGLRSGGFQPGGAGFGSFQDIFDAIFGGGDPFGGFARGSAHCVVVFPVAGV